MTDARPRRAIRRLVGATGLLLSAACGPDPVPLADYEPFAGLTPELHLGMRAAELREVRPGFHIDDDGIYGELLEPWELTYAFAPKDDDVPPQLTARLVAVGARVQRRDSAALWTEWWERVDSYAETRGAEPECWVLGDARVTLSYAAFTDSLTWRVAAEIHRGPDGQQHEAFLGLRLGRGVVETPWEESVTRHEVPCDALPR